VSYSSLNLSALFFMIGVAVSQVQLGLASERIGELRQELKGQHRQHKRRSGTSGLSAEEHFEQVMDLMLYPMYSDHCFVLFSK
jgi:hypothetical protein